MGMHCDHTVHDSTNLNLWLIVQYSGHPGTKACPPILSRLLPVTVGREVGIDVQTRRDTSRTVEDGAQVTIEC